MMNGKTLFLAAMMLFGSAARLFAECPLPGTPTEELKRASAVFSGKVVDKERRKITDFASEDFGGEQLFVKLQVVRWWKGSGEKEMVMRTSTVYFPDSIRQFAEGFDFLSDETYLIYAFHYNGAFGTSMCTRSRKLTEADADLKELGEGFAPTEKKE